MFPDSAMLDSGRSSKSKSNFVYNFLFFPSNYQSFSHSSIKTPRSIDSSYSFPFYFWFSHRSIAQILREKNEEKHAKILRKRERQHQMLSLQKERLRLQEEMLEEEAMMEELKIAF